MVEVCSSTASSQQCARMPASYTAIDPYAPALRAYEQIFRGIISVSYVAIMIVESLRWLGVGEMDLPTAIVAAYP
jgi:hypothetical protein